MTPTPKGRCFAKMAAALLATVYGLVVLSATPEWVAWQGPLVIGTLDVQTTDSGFPSPGDDPAEAERLLALLALLSAGAALLLSSKRLSPPENRSGEERTAPARGSPRAAWDR